MKDYQKISLEDHPEYLDYAVQMLTAKEYELVSKGIKGEELETKLQEYRKELGL